MTPLCPILFSRYSTGMIPDSKLFVLAVFGAVDLPLASCVLMHFLYIKFRTTVGL